MRHAAVRKRGGPGRVKNKTKDLGGRCALVCSRGREEALWLELSEREQERNRK